MSISFAEILRYLLFPFCFSSLLRSRSSWHLCVFVTSSSIRRAFVSFMLATILFSQRRARSFLFPIFFHSPTCILYTHPACFLLGLAILLFYLSSRGIIHLRTPDFICLLALLFVAHYFFPSILYCISYHMFEFIRCTSSYWFFYSFLQLLREFLFFLP